MEAFSPRTKKAAKTCWRFVAHYLWGMFATSVNGGITAVDAAFGLAVGAAVTSEVSKPTFIAVLSIFLTTAGRKCLTYLRDHPLPEKLDDGSVAPFSIPPKPQNTTT